MAGESFTGSSLEQALRDGTLAHPAGIVITCMVKESETQGHISIALSGCEQWTDISTDMVETAELIGHRPCKEHQHPFVRITFKEPRGVEAKTFASLLSQMAEATLGPVPFPLPSNFPAAASRFAPALPVGSGGGTGGASSCEQRCFQHYLDCIRSPYPGPNCELLLHWCVVFCQPGPI